MKPLFHRPPGSAAHATRSAMSLATSVAVGLWLVVFAYYAAAFSQLRPDRASDFAVYYIDAIALRQHRDPYLPADFAAVAATQLSVPQIEVAHASDPPTFLFLLEPLTLVSYPAAYWIWTTFNLLAFAAGILLLLELCAQNLSRAILWIVIALALLYHPVTSHLSFGQSRMVIFFLLCTALYFDAFDYAGAAAIALALSVLMRVFPIFMLGYFALRGRLRLLAYTIGALLAGWLLTVALLGPRTTFAFLGAIPYLTRAVLGNNTGNIAPGAVAIRLLATLIRHHPRLAVPYPLQLLLEWLPGLIALFFTLKLTWYLHGRRDCDYRLFALWVAAMLVTLRVERESDLVLLIIPFALIAFAAFEGRAEARAICAALLAWLVPTLEWALRHLAAPARPWLGAFHHATTGLQVFGLAAAYLAAYWLAAGALPQAPGDEQLPLVSGALPG